MPPKTANASIRDRTQEFFGIAERVKKPFSSQNGASSSGSKLEEPPRSAAAMQSEFNRRASRIGFGIHQTSQKLAKLAKLAKRTSVFDDPTMEIQELTAVIKQDITALNSAVVDLQLLSSSRNESGQTSTDTTTHSTTVVDDLKNRLMGATKEFKDVLTLRTEETDVLFFRFQESYKSFYSSASLGCEVCWGNLCGTSPSMGQRQRIIIPNAPQQQQNQQQQLVPLQDSYMQSRAEALQNVESTIHELSNIFNQLATLVSQQGEIAIRIDENMDDTVANVEGAQGALLKYLNSISSNRWLMIKIFFVLIFFLMIFLFFVA
ncbi:syntaxin-32 [Phtheirospermum japonicum]|uniref:Syntaxin-32 n=1 Tax=Phtheirospermum japonicum TaxID=374723 RepID=A0A830BHJ4_9LAMI|nr:syntaxin-32 [Phtheirospermum japonicum]